MNIGDFVDGLVEVIRNNSNIEADEEDAMFEDVKGVYQFGNGLIVELEDGHEIRVKVTVE